MHGTLRVKAHVNISIWTNFETWTFLTDLSYKSNNQLVSRKSFMLFNSFITASVMKELNLERYLRLNEIENGMYGM